LKNYKERILDIDKIMEEWHKDAKIDNTELDDESTKIPQTHSKWLAILTQERQKLRKYNIHKQVLYKKLQEYYRGESTLEDLAELKREPYEKIILKSEINSYVDVDPKIIDITLKISYQEETVDVLKEIIYSINQRNFNIKNAITWKQLTNFGA
jgi:hypothetical protein